MGPDRSPLVPIHTPHGLKIRLSEDGLERVLGENRERFRLSEALFDVERWGQLRVGLSNAGAISAALLTHSVKWTLAVAVVAWVLGNLIQTAFFSRMLLAVFSRVFGLWLVAVPASLALFVYLKGLGSPGAGVAALVVVAANWSGFWNPILLLVAMPARVAVMRLRGGSFTFSEVAFVGALNEQARQIGLRLDWNRY